MKLTKKSQISQIFIYILALFIFALIVFYGFHSILSFKKKAEQVLFIKSKTQLENEVEILVSELPGAVSIFNKNKPLKFSGYDEICIVSSNLIGTKENELPLEMPPLIKSSVAAGVKENVFFFPIKEHPSVYLKHVIVAPDSNNFECFDLIQNRLDIRLESKAGSVLIIPYQE